MCRCGRGTLRPRARPVGERKQHADDVGDVFRRGQDTIVLALDVLEERQCLAQRPQCAFHAGLAVRFGRRVLRFEERPDRLRYVLGDREDFIWNVGFLLQYLECFAKRFASVPRVVRP